jgi:tetratricopeptide (TPR) repeat protein
MTRNATSTSRPTAGDRASAADTAAVEEAARLVEQAEGILGNYLEPGRVPAARVARRFLMSGDLELVLGLYMQAMKGDPEEPAYPWNLASSLDRLRQSDLALVFVRRAIRVAREVGDLEWAGAAVHLALADIAIRAGELGAAERAIEQAHSIDPTAPVERYRRHLRRESAAQERGGERTRHEARAALPQRVFEELAVFECAEAGRQ